MPCPVANECGGCDWTALRLDKQLEAKRRILTESLRRIGKFDVGALPEIAMHPSPLNYRLRSRLHRDGDAVGFYAMRSNRVVPLARGVRGRGRRETGASSAGGRAQTVGARAATSSADERDFTLTVDRFTYRLNTHAFFQVNRHLLGTMLRLVTHHAKRVQTPTRPRSISTAASGSSPCRSRSSSSA